MQNSKIKWKDILQFDADKTVRYRMTMVSFSQKINLKTEEKKSDNIQKCLQRCDPTIDTIICQNSHTNETLSLINNTRKHEKNISIPWKTSDNFLLFLPSLRLGKILVHIKIIWKKSPSLFTLGLVERSLVLEIGRQGAGEGARCARPGVAAGRTLFHAKALNMGMTFIFLAPLRIMQYCLRWKMSTLF